MAKKGRTEKLPGVVAYCRVSTEEQAVSGLGLTAQEKAIRAACEARGAPLVALYREKGERERPSTAQPSGRPWRTSTPVGATS